MTSQTLTAEPFLSGLYFGECPRWHEGRLWYSDFFDHAVFSVSPDGERRQEVDFDGEPAGLGWLPDGRLLINSRLDRVVMRREARRHAGAARGPAAVGHLARQRHGRAPPTARPTPATSASTSTASTTGRLRPERDQARVAHPGRSGRHQLRGGRRHRLPQRHGHHRGRRHADHRREHGRPPHGVRSRGRRHPDQPPRVGGARRCGARRHLPVRGQHDLGGQRARAPSASACAEGGEVLERVATSTNCFACMLGDEDRRTPLPGHRARQPRRQGPGRTPRRY